MSAGQGIAITGVWIAVALSAFAIGLWSLGATVVAGWVTQDILNSCTRGVSCECEAPCCQPTTVHI